MNTLVFLVCFFLTCSGYFSQNDGEEEISLSDAYFRAQQVFILSYTIMLLIDGDISNDRARLMLK